MNNDGTLYADLALLYMGRMQTTFKGDVPGHPFHGNQYGEGQGGGSGGAKVIEMGSGSVELQHDKGSIKLTKRGNTLSIDDVYIPDPNDRGKGIGTQMYHELSKYARNNHLKIESGITVENPAVRIWQKLKKEGLPVTFNDNAREAEGGGYWHANQEPVAWMDYRQ